MEQEPDVELNVSVRADEVRFECKPRVDVVAWADSPATVEAESERQNLPDEVEPGVVYRDIAVHLRLAARLNEPNWEEAVSGIRRARRLSRNVPPREL